MEHKRNLAKNIFFGLFCIAALLNLSSFGSAFFIIGGGGGGDLPPTPTLYQPTSPDYDGHITLTWSGSYLTKSYKVYRSSEEYGTYTYIGWSLSTSFTDIRDPDIPNTWYYKVKAFNYYGSSGYSNIRSVIVASLPTPKQLIGSNNRFFPKCSDSKLGFTIETQQSFTDDPIIEFSITETSTSPNFDISLSIDGNEVWYEDNIDIDEQESFTAIIQVEELRNKGTHQIVIEISNGINQELDYFGISRLLFTESYLYSDENHEDRFVPLQVFSYDQSSDEAVIAITNCLYIDNEDLEISGSYVPEFSTEISFWINPDKDYYHEIVNDFGEFVGVEEYWYFINSMKLQWKVIDNNGDFLTYDDLNYDTKIHPSYNGDEIYYEMESLFDAFSIIRLFLNLPLYITFPLNLLLLTLDTTPNPPKTSIDQAETNPPTIEGSWTTSTRQLNPNVELGVGTVPNPESTESSMQIYYSPYLTLDNYGSFQVQMTWILDLDRHWRQDAYYHYITDGIELEGTYFYNFEYFNASP